MAKFSNNASDWLNFSKSERWAILIFSGLIILLNLIPFYYPPQDVEPWVIQFCQSDSSSIASSVTLKEKNSESPYTPEKRRGLTLVKFNPNLVTQSQLLKMGIAPKTAATWVHFLEKGGHFYKATDLFKLYGLKPAIVEQLMPYVDLPQKEISSPSQSLNKGRLVMEKKLSWLDINLADSADWEKLAGIGPTLARRIVLFREKLGGFYKIDQVGETFGLQDSVFLKIKPQLKIGERTIKKIKVNQADWATLKEHPYIRSLLAGIIIKYRKNHTRIENMQTLYDLMQVDRNQLEKLMPYLSFDE